MKRTHWDSLRQLIDRLAQQEEAVASINDPEHFAAAYDDIWKLKMTLLSELIGPQLAERLGVARIARSSLALTPSWLPEAAQAGGIPVAPLQAMDQDEAATQRRMIIQFLLDFSDALPPGLAVNMAAALNLLNLNAVTPLVAPATVQGLRGGSGRYAVAFFYFSMGVYYRVGFTGRTVEAVLLENAAIIDISRNAFDKTVRKLNIRPSVEAARLEGQADARAGKAMRPQWGGDYDLQQLEKLMRKEVGKENGANIIPFGGKKR
ncbi:hypothetical protein G5V57_24360 [Nordella sp. HKS 07]|uniref:hypothetical protein n=1 Tax=Nordella sp. HKS 07 TaxID=2712222 RepID=UPI0013E1279F|nr:hypothetical protein [Nordella sp. HKS 07]QIG50586.1 hypothetical protein G5V57_24360 [Nordella sp. HKS 07]